MMSLLCPQNYIPSNISTSMDQIQVSLKNAPSELQKYYRQKQTCDVIIKYDAKEFLAHRFIIEKNSNLFVKGLVKKIGQKWFIELGSRGKIGLLQKIISCMYGYSVTIKRYEVQQAYQISKALELQQLLRQFHNDMLNHFDQYDIFPLLKLSTQQKITSVSELCYDQLQIQMFEPMRYNKSGLFLCDQQLFKSIIKRHNLIKCSSEKFGLSDNQINSIVDEYCHINGITGLRKQKILQDIQNKENLRYYVSLNQVLRKPSTPRKTKSSSEIFFRNVLTLPRQKEQGKINSYMIPKNRRVSPISPCNNSFTSDNLKIAPSNLVSLGNICKSETSERSTDNRSTQNISQANRSRKQSSGSIQTLIDPRILIKLTEITQNQSQIKEQNENMKSKAQELMNRLKHQLSSSKQSSQKFNKLSNHLEELTAQIRSSKQKLQQLQKVVDNIVITAERKEAQRKFNELFDTKVDLDLTVSRAFGSKNCK